MAHKLHLNKYNFQLKKKVSRQLYHQMGLLRNPNSDLEMVSFLELQIRKCGPILAELTEHTGSAQHVSVGYYCYFTRPSVSQQALSKNFGWDNSSL